MIKNTLVKRVGISLLGAGMAVSPGMSYGAEEVSIKNFFGVQGLSDVQRTEKLKLQKKIDECLKPIGEDSDKFKEVLYRIEDCREFGEKASSALGLHKLAFRFENPYSGFVVNFLNFNDNLDIYLIPEGDFDFKKNRRKLDAYDRIIKSSFRLDGNCYSATMPGMYTETGNNLYEESLDGKKIGLDAQRVCDRTLDFVVENINSNLQNTLK